MTFTNKDYSKPPRHEIFNPIVRFLRRKLAESGVSVETVANAANLDTKTVRNIFDGIVPGKHSTLTSIASAFGYEVALKRVSDPLWTRRPNRATFGEWGRANTPLDTKTDLQSPKCPVCSASKTE